MGVHWVALNTRAEKGHSVGGWHEVEHGPEGVMTLCGTHQWYRFFSGI